ncbi:hypothetical protein [Gloeobacter kilaueensis]|uniref:Uncharacterized protein n=1 Tax=Gloeobacter kilaueensis (strain ATCC BAA-2537 / CCAP 1431/1 / ULC 316 / JS1) TaxID=1183438 RepID=U5QLL1_GLOK1|nr:hypothetical protein [Gloeobacter kilaueensis]AGY58570.1 hypothetical protein GKIL_2324 [Gloeobacter kilaueensis JS1]
MDLQNRRTNLLLLTVLLLTAMLVAGVMVLIFQERQSPGPVKSAQSGSLKVQTIQKWLRQLPDQVQLEKARTLAAGGQSADLLAAVGQLSAVGRESPVYLEAQQKMRLWNRQVLEKARKEAESPSPRALQAAIALAVRIPAATPGYEQAQAQARQWQQALNSATAVATAAPPAPPPLISAPSPQGRPAPRSQPAPSLKESDLEDEQLVDGVTLSAIRVRVLQSGEFRITAQLANNSTQRYVFLPGFIKLTDGNNTDMSAKIKLSSPDGIVDPEGVVRLTIIGQGGWQPPYRLAINEMRPITGQPRNFNLLIAP